MLKEYFWELVDNSCIKSGGDRAKQLELIKAELDETTSDIIKRYCVYIMELLKEACTEDMWIAYFNMNGGYEEWGFEDFRYWIIAHGEDFWKKSIQDPTNFLHENVNFKEGDNPDVTFYEFWSLFKTIYEQKSAAELNNQFEWIKAYENVQEAELEIEKIMRPKVYDYTIRKCCPKMYDKFHQQYYYLLKIYQDKKKV